MSFRHNLAVYLTKFYLRHGRGHSLLDFVIVFVKNTVYFGVAGILAKQWFDIDLPKFVIISLALLFEISCYLMGNVDEKVGFWKYQNSYMNKELNPFFEEIGKDVKIIKDSLKK